MILPSPNPQAVERARAERQRLLAVFGSAEKSNIALVGICYKDGCICS